jgi:hypothetical protein
VTRPRWLLVGRPLHWGRPGAEWARAGPRIQVQIRSLRERPSGRPPAALVLASAMISGAAQVLPVAVLMPPPAAD